MNFFDRMKNVINQGLEMSKDALNVAAEKAKEMGERGVLRYEISKLEKDVEKNLALIGTNVYNLLVKQGKDSVNKDTTEIKQLLDEVKSLEGKITEREKQLEDLKNEESKKGK